MTPSDLYEEFERELRGYATGLTHDADWADDLAQDTFIRAMGHLPLLEQLLKHQQRAWLRRTCKNLFLDGLRSRRRQEALLLQLVEPEEEWPTLSPDVSIQEIFEHVPDRFRHVLHQHYVLGMNSAEIGRSLGVPAATVRSRLHLAIQWLRSHQALIGY
jgi:RNA polymerase sigma-70 factor (ECF subfamily)